MAKINRALVSVSDKTGLAAFARELAEFGVDVLSTGGTARMLREEGLSVTDVSDYTGFPEMMDGRVKTLHPKVHGALLGLRDNDEHLSAMAAHNITPIDMVVVNLYPFEKTIAKGDCSFMEAIENIDIGGPSMLRSASKNFASVTVIIDPADYEKVIQDMRENNGSVSVKTNYELACKVYRATSSYDAAIATYLAGQSALFDK